MQELDKNMMPLEEQTADHHHVIILPFVFQAKWRKKWRRKGGKEVHLHRRILQSSPTNIKDTR